ncbi:hypothetical protein CRI94_07005 [Longibacter salinarum]|uniref:PorV/PorQ family protein n=2 Tax=Longibacter salinarum TaxID=1850348 RepID=A0A2A8CZJ2_9BACT|nr:hypothetical protein CRI94_07005 [Longibacter salinarum]
MGGAYVAHASEITAGYWNPAGLYHISSTQVSYMHVSRFSGAVTFDYGGVAVPLDERSALGISFFRSGVNDIVNTLNAWDPVLQQPRANYESLITTFSAADWALFLSYSRKINERLSAGVNFKGIRRSIGDFAQAYGYSMDAGAQYRVGVYRFGVNIQDLSTMLQSWSVNREEFQLNGDEINPDTGQPYTFSEVFGQDLPQGGTELVLPVVRLGSGAVWPVGDRHSATAGFDVDVAFDGQRAFVPNMGDVSFHPRVGGAFNYAGVAEVRAGLQRIQTGGDLGGITASPTVGAGVRLDRISLDLSFGDFVGITAEDLGFTYRLSAIIRLQPPDQQ